MVYFIYFCLVVYYLMLFDVLFVVGFGGNGFFGVLWGSLVRCVLIVVDFYNFVLVSLLLINLI